jgi:hypothetical protein
MPGWLIGHGKASVTTARFVFSSVQVMPVQRKVFLKKELVNHEKEPQTHGVHWAVRGTCGDFVYDLHGGAHI